MTERGSAVAHRPPDPAKPKTYPPRRNRPGFSTAAPPEEGQRLYEHFAKALASAGVPVETGRFGAEMKVALTNDGPVTIWLDTAG